MAHFTCKPVYLNTVLFVVYTRFDSCREMPVVHVEASGISAAICLKADIAVVPKKGVFLLFRVYDPADAEAALVTLSFDTMRIEKITLDHERLWMKFGHVSNGSPTFLDFRSKKSEKLEYYDKTRCLQRFWRREKAKARRQALFLGLHPRLGANSPIVEEIVANMVMFSLI
jgi:hypothetical protein